MDVIINGCGFIMPIQLTLLHPHFKSSRSATEKGKEGKEMGLGNGLEEGELRVREVGMEGIEMDQGREER